MSERTTIGGTVYEAIGSSSSNLLLKCNGTARIQWGGKLIDLVKNGKIASGDSKELIFIVSSESEIKADGVYILTTEESNQLWICKDGNKYDLTNADLYISASKPQTLTVEQKKQALDNIGMYYDTLESVQKAGIQNGIVYVIDNKTLYTVKGGVIEEFEAKIKTVTVDNSDENGDVIRGKVKLVLSILDDEYLILADQRITANYSIHVKESAQVGSESADKTKGYRLYIDGGVSWLDVDEINVRNGIKIKQYEEVTFEELDQHVKLETLKPHMWYLITDYQNPWRLVVDNTKFNRPILVRALNKNTLYEFGYLFRDHRIKIKYDYTHQDMIVQVQAETSEEKNISTRGKIVWMKDCRNNNEANFDFMDYSDHNGDPLCTLHKIENDKSEDLSVFPYGSHDNKLTVYNLKNTVFVEGLMDNTNTNTIDFQYQSIENPETKELSKMSMYNNNIECRGIILQPSCVEFYNNNLKGVIKLEIGNYFCDNDLKEVYCKNDFSILDPYDFESITDDSAFNSVYFNYKTSNVKCNKLRYCGFNNQLIDNTFGDIDNTIFNQEVKGTTIDSIIRTSNIYYQYNLSKITDSYIGTIEQELVFTGEIINSSIETIQNLVQLLGIIENSKITIIKDEAVLEGTLEGCTINELNKCRIKGKLTNCNVNYIINNTSIDSEISESIIDTLDNCTIIGNVSKSNFGTIINSNLESEINNCKIQGIDTSTIMGNLSNSTFGNISNSNFNSEINTSSFKDISQSGFNAPINKSKFEEISNCVINASMDEVDFQPLTGGSFNTGNITKTVSFYSLSENFDEAQHTLLYNPSKRKEIYVTSKGVKIICIPDVVFYRGMIIMHSGIEEIPEGWAICDGGEYEFEGVKSLTPNLVNRFIKAVGSTSEIKEVKNEVLNDDNEWLFTKEYLPKHRHDIDITTLPQYTTDDINGYTSRYDPRSMFVTTTQGTLSVYVSVGVSVSVGDASDSDSDSSSDSISLSGETLNYMGVDPIYETIKHYHRIDWGSSNIVTEENDKDTEQKLIKLEPHYYALVFIMKL